MSSTTTRDLERLRRWRTWLLVVTMTGQGVQYLVSPARPLAVAAYANLHALGAGGWRVIGCLFIAAAAAMAIPRWRPWGHLFAAVLYLLLLWATWLHGYWPSLSILAAGLNCGEFWQWQTNRRRKD